MITHDATDKPKNAHKRNEQLTLTTSMALEILQTSLNYVRGCGLAVRISNDHGLCVIGIAGAELDHGTHGGQGSGRSSRDQNQFHRKPPLRDGSMASFRKSSNGFNAVKTSTVRAPRRGDNTSLSVKA